MNTQSHGPLVHLVSIEDVAGEAKNIFKKMKETTGKIPKWMKVMGNSETVFVHFFKLFAATMKEGKIDPILKWKIAYKVSELNKCEFCVSVTKIQLKNFGLSDEEISTIDKPDNGKEALILQFAESSTEHAYKINPKVKAKIRELCSDEEIVELTATVGLFNYINRFNDALGVFPDM
jgi:AhpD family alkylhydroperoxidase